VKSHLYDIERILKERASNYLSVLEQRFSVKCILHRVVQNTETRVYGVEAGEEGYKRHSEFSGIVTNDNFFPSDDYSSGTMAEGYLYTTSTSPQVGDLVEVHRGDKKSRRFKIETLESLGTTEKTFKKFKLSSVGD
jgi:hypothetical protein